MGVAGHHKGLASNTDGFIQSPRTDPRRTLSAGPDLEGKDGRSPICRSSRRR
jgi:hypothetical protein